MNPTLVQLLQSMPIFGGLSEPALETILAASKQAEVAPGRFLFREGDPAESLFVLKSGQIAIQKCDGNIEIILGKLGTGDCIGEMALIDFQPRSASAIALQDCETIEIDTRSLRALMTEDLMQYTLIMMNMGREVSRRLRAADNRILELEQSLRGGK
jgi:CRP-like cAMP-binding protein